MTPLESLLLETIPVRISPPPSTELGPTEQLRIRQAHEEWLAHKDEETERRGK